MQILACPSLAYKSLSAPGMGKIGPQLRLILLPPKKFQASLKRFLQNRVVIHSSPRKYYPKAARAAQLFPDAFHGYQLDSVSIFSCLPSTHEICLSANHSSLLSQNKTHHVQPGIPCQSYFPLSISQMHSYLFPHQPALASRARGTH